MHHERYFGEVYMEETGTIIQRPSIAWKNGVQDGQYGPKEGRLNDPLGVEVVLARFRHAR
jgi:hypothetical protein